MIGTVGSDEKAQKAKAAGARETINYNKEDIVERVLALTNGEKSVWYMTLSAKTPAAVTGLPEAPRPDGQLRQRLRPGHRC